MEFSYSTIKVKKDERGVVTVVMNRPEVKNAFNDEMIRELTDCFTKLGHEDSVRLVVLTGAGDCFCAGADLHWMKKMKNYTQEENFEDSLRLSRLFQTINSFAKPVVGKVNGHAMGGGVGLIAVCDFALASSEAMLGFTEARLGLVPAVISPFVMAKIGESHARATFLSAVKFNAHKAKRMGLLHEVVEAFLLDEYLEKVVNKFLKSGPVAQQTAKNLIQTVKKLARQSEMDVFDYTCRTIALARVSDEGQEGMNALLDKRPPNWVDGNARGEDA